MLFASRQDPSFLRPLLILRHSSCCSFPCFVAFSISRHAIFEPCVRVVHLNIQSLVVKCAGPEPWHCSSQLCRHLLSPLHRIHPHVPAKSQKFLLMLQPLHNSLRHIPHPSPPAILLHSILQRLPLTLGAPQGTYLQYLESLVRAAKAHEWMMSLTKFPLASIHQEGCPGMSRSVAIPPPAQRRPGTHPRHRTPPEEGPPA
mmetsp:Transcript_47322/g.90342  ORF Transcript_47322/g.90342 Transcript_47322/m.90342 type:complete len:201 (-) Transcript_47322:1081-1683(-)